MEIKWALPRSELRSVVRSFQERRVDLGGAALSWPVPARPHQILDIHLAETYQISIDDGSPSKAPDIFVVGPQTYRRAHVRLSGRVHVFNILFQPTGLNRLIGIDMTSLVNQDSVASDILGKSAVILGDAVRAVSDFHQRVAAVESWVAAMLDRRGRDTTIGAASRQMIAVRGNARIDELIAKSGLSTSQFQRRFATQVGMTPKLFARTIRFDRVLVARRADPDRPWTDIVHELGYFDQAHFIRECHAFAGLAPGSLVGDWDNVFFPHRRLE